jgi:hypothetical protein
MLSKILVKNLKGFGNGFMKLILKEPHPLTAITIHVPIPIIVMNRLDIALSTASTHV